MKRLLAASLALALAGCATPAPKAPHPDKAAIEAAEIARYSDQQLCQASDAIQPSLNVNPSSHPEYNDNLSRSKALEAAARSRNLSCYKLKAANSKAIKPMTARQKQARATAVCEGYAQRTQFANPSVAYSMCLKGAQSPPEKCTRDNTHFSSEATKLTGASRAEYTEIGNAFRIGCNLN